MRLRKQTGWQFFLLIALLVGSIASPSSAQTPAGGAAADWVSKLAGLETAPDLDIAVLRQQVADRVKSRADGVATKRPPVAPQLIKLPQLVVEIRFDEDAAVIRPESYQTLGRIADVLTDPKLLAYKFLIVVHTVSAGRRENNLTLSQRRADVIREVLVNTFKISSKRLQAIGLGEEQFVDATRPAAAVNQRIQIATVGSALVPERPAPAKAAPAPRPPGKPAKKPR
ncbi:MAG TPA: OmpA family protein [Bradyrhizobium sp.]|jgi:outer membrane protein OmpA-like peptidoglycan-associated protein